jgi:hypothetical protein
MRSMTTRQHRYWIRLLLAALLTSGAAWVQASSTSLAINATVLEVQCTIEQRVRIRACAPAQENYTIEPLKALVRVPTVTNGNEPLIPQFDVQPDFGRRVMIRTVLY